MTTTAELDEQAISCELATLERQIRQAAATAERIQQSASMAQLRGLEDSLRDVHTTLDDVLRMLGKLTLCWKSMSDEPYPEISPDEPFPCCD